MFYTIVNATRY